MIALTAVASVSEALLLVVVARVAVVVTGGPVPTELQLGPLQLVIPEGTTPLFSWGLLLLTIRLATQLAGNFVVTRAATDTLASLRKRTVSLFLRASHATQIAEPEGYIQDVLSTYVGRTTACINVVSNSCAAAVNFLTMLVAAFAVAPKTAAIVIASVCVMFVGFRPLSNVGRRYAQARTRAGIRLAHSVAQAADQTVEIRTTHVIDRVNDSISSQVDRIQQLEFRGQLLAQSLGPLYQALGLLSLLAALAILSAAGSPTAATLGAVLLLLLRAMNYSQTLQTSLHSLHELVPYAEVLQDVHTRHAAAQPPAGRTPLTGLETLRLRDMGLEYQPGGTALDGITFDLPPGEMLGVIGPSGAGKSSLIQILLGLRPPTRGEFLVGDVPHHELRQDDWFGHVAFVPQEPRMIVGSVSENIRYWRDMSDEALMDAARRANIHDEINTWAEGYETQIGPRGATLSGGQKQRIAIARALAAGPSLLVLDEPTSALDPESESLIGATLRAMKGKVTIVLIAHRMSTVAACDRLLVLNHGRVEALGSPAEIVGASEFYREALIRSSVTESS